MRAGEVLPASELARVERVGERAKAVRGRHLIAKHLEPVAETHADAAELGPRRRGPERHPERVDDVFPAMLDVRSGSIAPPRFLVALMRNDQVDVSHRTRVTPQRQIAERSKLSVDVETLVERSFGRGTLVGSRRIGLAVAVHGGDRSQLRSQSVHQPRVVGRFAETGPELRVPTTRLAGVGRLLFEARHPRCDVSTRRGIGRAIPMSDHASRSQATHVPVADAEEQRGVGAQTKLELRAAAELPIGGAVAKRDPRARRHAFVVERREAACAVWRGSRLPTRRSRNEPSCFHATRRAVARCAGRR